MTAPAPATDVAAPLAGGGQLVIAPRGATASTPRLSPRTGEVQRPVLQGVASGLLALGCVVSAVVLFGSLWTMATGALPDSGWLVRRLNPTELVWQVLMPLMNAGLVVPAIGASGVTAFHAWNGSRWTPWAGLAAAGLSLLTLLVWGPLSWVAAGLHVLGAALLWLPPLARYRRAQTAHLAARGLPEHTHVMPAQVRYGPLPRYR